MEHPKTLKDLRWFLLKDLELYNKPQPSKRNVFGRNDCDYDVITFDVDTTDGIYKIMNTSEGIYFYPDDETKKAYILGGCHIKNFDKLPLPLEFDIPYFTKYHSSSYDPDLPEEKRKRSSRDRLVALNYNKY